MDEDIVRSRALASRIRNLLHHERVCFAAGCAERALPILEYENYSNNPKFLATFCAVLDFVWGCAEFDAILSPEQIGAVHQAIEEMFPTGDFYSGYDGTVSAGVAIQCAVDAISDSSGEAAAKVSLHVSSAYKQVTQWDDEPTDDLDWHEQAVSLLERNPAVSRHMFAGLPAPPKLGAES
jgi:hypothetical protein